MGKNFVVGLLTTKTTKILPPPSTPEKYPLYGTCACACFFAGNFTTNLAESWMHIRSKFDGGKQINQCFVSND